MELMSAYQLRAKFDAGLLLAGQDDDGDLEWIGTNEQFIKADKLEKEYEELSTLLVDF